VNVSADTSTPRGISTESSPNAQSFEEEKNEESAEKKTDLDLSIVGVSLDDIEIQNELDMEEEEEEDAILDISSKDFVRIIHGNKEVMLVMPTEVRYYHHIIFWYLHHVIPLLLRSIYSSTTSMHLNSYLLFYRHQVTWD